MSRALSPSFPSLHPRDKSFSNPYVALPTPQLVLQPFHCFTYVTAHSPTLLSPLLHHRLFTYVTWRAAHVWFSSWRLLQFMLESWWTNWIWERGFLGVLPLSLATNLIPPLSLLLSYPFTFFIIRPCDPASHLIVNKHPYL